MSISKIAVYKHSALVDPSHSTSEPLPVYLGPIDGHMMCLIIQFVKKIVFRKMDIYM